MEKTINKQIKIFTIIKTNLVRVLRFSSKVGFVRKKITVLTRYIFLLLARGQITRAANIKVSETITLNKNCKIVLVTDEHGKYLVGVGRDSIGPIVEIPSASVRIGKKFHRQKIVGHAE